MDRTGEWTAGDTQVTVVTGDLTRQEVDAVVNAANVHLQHGGGVAGALARAGGPSIQRESDAYVTEHGPLEEGEAAVTGGGDLPAGHVIHTAGPVFEAGSDRNEPRLRQAVRAALDAGAALGARSMAFPAISAGIYGYPPDQATAVVADEVVAFLTEHADHGLAEVRLVGFDDAAAALFAKGVEAALAGR